jgi:hypothetical protein
MRYFSVLCIKLAVLILLPEGYTQAQNSQGAELYGTVRTVYTWIDSRDRSGNWEDSDALNARVQLGMRVELQENLTFETRVAGRYATNQDEFQFVIEDHTPPSGSYPAGTTTIDQFQITWRISPSVELTAGRFQGRFPLQGFIPKGMDRYYAANLSISHTDGVWLKWDLNRNWRLHMIGNHNGRRGSSHAARAPMVFAKSESRISGFLNLEHLDKEGLWVQRELSMSYYPQSFVRNGRFRDMVVLTSRAMIRLPAELRSGEIWMGGELGVIPYSPTAASAGIDVSQDRIFFDPSAISWQISAYANDLIKNHRLGILYGQTEPGWVISSSFRPNNTMAEIRYRYTFSRALNFEMRYRIRTDLFKPESTGYTQRDRDFYARFTYRF